jgi:hypothetical protein
VLDHPLGLVHVTADDGARLREYAQHSLSIARVFFNGTQLGLKAGSSPMVAGFSGRGPSINTLGIVKPDILAPSPD